MDIFKAYLLACFALGTLRVVQGWRWSSGRSAPLQELRFGSDAIWTVVSVAVLVAAPAMQVKGVAIWSALGTLGGWLMLPLWSTKLRSRGRLMLPDCHHEYMLWFGLGLAGIAVNALARYSMPEPLPLSMFLLQPVGLIWLVGLSALVARTLYDLFAGLMQRSFDRGVLGGLQGHPKCSELFGDIRQILRKHEESERVTGDDVLVYRVEGSRAAGVVVAEFRQVNDPANERVNEVVQGLVYMDTGERSSLNVGSGASSA